MKQKRKTLRKKQLNNKGFSLVELILAMIILAVVVTPFLHAFLTSTKVNAKARIKSQATTLAQNVMEGMKTEVYTMDASGNYTDITLPHLSNVMYQFTYPTLSSSFDNFFILPKDVLTNATVGEIVQSAPSVTSTDGGLTYKFNENSNYQYYLYLLNVVHQGTPYDVLISLDGSSYADTATSGQNFNAVELVQIPSVDTKYDAVSTKNFDAEAIADFTAKVSLYGETYQAGNLSRVITIDLTTDNAGKVKTTCKYDYSYYVNASVTLDYNCQEVTIFSGNASDFRNIYLYYYPNYGSTQTNVKDRIVVNNNINTDSSIGKDPYPFQLFLIKQQDTTLSDFNLKTKENGYRCYVYINDTITLSSEPSPISIRTNLGTNLFASLDTSSGTNYSILNQAIYFHNNLAYSDADARSKYQINVVTNKGSKTAYLVETVKVYQHTLNTTPSLSDFAAKQPVVTLDGSFVN